MKMTVTEFQAWLADFGQAIEANKGYLSELDTPIGDGDHGNNMARGMAAYEADFAAKQPTSIADTAKILAMALISNVGGASGPLYGSAFMGITKAVKDIVEIDSQEQLGEVMEQGLQMIQLRGKAAAEDKTMVDVWLPAVAALKKGQLTETVVRTAKEHTAELVAKKGRASYLGERAIGHIDPGAASSELLFVSLLKYL